jgi:hypothetical protein
MFRVWITTLLAVCLSFPIAAQTVSGTITGTIVDPSSLPVAGATVTLRNQNTGQQTAQTAGASGGFVFAAVLPGTYTITVEMKGFKKVEKTDVNITAAERLAAGEFVLQIGSIAEAVTVSAEGTPVQTMSQDRSAVVTEDQMSMLMSRGRDLLTLLRVLPGVNPTADPAAIGRTGFPNIQGMRMTYSTVSIDGASVNDLGSMQAMGAPTNMDAIGEIKVLLSNYQAEYGRTGGGLINAVTKAGTSQFHGTAYYYKRHEQFNANTYFNNLNKVVKPRYRYNTWGGTIGGPVPLGHFNRNHDKLFFFYSQEYLPTASPGSLQRITVPTAAELSGDFSSTLDTGNKLVVINDPNNNKQPFAGNKIPTGMLNRNGQILLSAFPRPNFTDRTVSGGNYNYLYQEVIKTKQTNEVFRVDANATDKIRMYLRGSFYRQPQDGSAVAGGMAQWGMLPSEFKYSADTAVYNLVYTISPTVVNEFSLSGHHIIQRTFPLNDADVQKLSRSALGYNLPQLYPGLNPLDMIPLASFGGVPGGASFSSDARYPLKSADNVIGITDNITKVRDNHILKAGVFIERVRYNGAAQGQNFGSFNFQRDSNNPLDSNYAYSNALLGTFYSYQESNSRIAPTGRATTFEWFAQDNWKVTKKLTLDLGVRFSTYGPYGQKNGRAAGFLPDQYSPAAAPRLYYPAMNGGARVAYDPVTRQYAPSLMIGAFVPNSGNTANGMVLDDGTKYPKGLMNHHTMLPAPRIGFAYDPTGSGKTAIRGGFGIVYNTRERVLLLDLISNPPVQYTPTIYYGNFNTLAQSAGTLFPAGSAGLAMNGNASSVMNMSLGVQRDIGFKTVVDVSYVGTLGRHLFQMHNLNTLPMGARFQASNQDPTRSGSPLPDSYFVPYRGYTSLNLEEYGGSSNYHSLQVQANRRFAHGIQFGANWTWARSMDYASNDWGSVAQYINRRVWNYGPSDFDKRHVVNVNWLWDVPKATKVVNNPVIAAVFDDWQVSGVATFATGSPTSPGYSTVDSVDLTGGGDGIRMIMNGNPNLSSGDRTFNRWFNTNVFLRPAANTIGNMQRNALYRPGTNNFDLTFFKNIPLHLEKARLQFRWEMYNAFNHTQFSGFNSSARFDALGNQTNTQFGQLNGTAAARLMQGSIRFLF